VSGDFGGDDTRANVVGVGQAEVLGGRNVAEEGCAVEGRCGAADCGGYVVVAGCNVGYDGAKDVEGGAAADLLLDFHIVLYLIEGDMARAFDHYLTAGLLGALGKLAEGP